MLDISDILDGLNGAQREAVACDDPYLLVLAGAGSGKTRVLVNRIAFLVASEQATPYSLLAVTFTNKAAHEMRGRLEQILQMPVTGMWVGTFHNIAHQLLRRHWQEAGLKENFEILDSDDQLRVIKRVMRELEVDEQRVPPRQVQWYINGQKDEGLRARHIEHHGDVFVKTMLRIYSAYEELTELNGWVDFNELLLRALELIRDNDDLRGHYQRRFRHLLVDEFQDTNAIQYAWLRLLAGGGAGITIVGDDDQSIYGWRGAKVENIQHLSRDFSPLKIIRLEQNYRSTGNILQAANAVINFNQGRLGKELWTESNDGDPIRLYGAFNEVDEARFVAARIQNLEQQGVSRNDIAVLYRSNAQSRVLEEAFLQLGIPYRIYGGQRFFERAEIKNTLAYLRLLNNRDSDAAFERVVNVPTRGIGEKTVEQIRALARAEASSLWQAANNLIGRGLLTNRAASALGTFLNLVEQLDQDTAELTLKELTEHVVEASGLLQFHRKEKGEKGQQREDNLKELISATGEFDTDDVPDDVDILTAFLDHASLESGEGQAEQHEQAVQMMTLHSAKGLEFKIVFMVGLEEGLFPSMQSVDEPGRLEEERRLCYVGITRAMEQLFICYAESRRLYGNENRTMPSRFIREIPAELVEEVRARGGFTRPRVASKAVVGGLSQTSSEGYALGARVRHPKFGDGTIIHFEGAGPNTRLQINFDSAGSKWLVSQYARLDII